MKIWTSYTGNLSVSFSRFSRTKIKKYRKKCYNLRICAIDEVHTITYSTVQVESDFYGFCRHSSEIIPPVVTFKLPPLEGKRL